MYSIYRKFANLFKFLLFHFFIIIFATHTVHAASIYLIWDENEESDLWGYRIYHGTSSKNYGSPVDAGKVTSFELSGLIEGRRYYIALTAYDTSNNESGKTDEVSGIAQPPSVTSTTSTTAPATTSTPENNTTTIPATTSIPGIATTTITGTTTSVVSGTTTILPDTTPPSGTITINDGDSATYSQSVTLTLFATDDEALVENTATVSKVRELEEGVFMSFSNDNTEWSNLEPYSITKVWNLFPGEGDKTVFVQFRDTAGNWMIEPAYDQIVLEESKITCEDPQKLQPVSIEASSESSPSRGKEKVADGNLRTSWSPPPKVSWNNEFITLDLGEIKQVDRINMYASKLFNLDFLPVDFQIQISSDNLNWEEIHTENNYTLQSTRSGSWDIDSYEARYIRIYITKAKTFLFFFHLVQIAEIEVYGCDIPEQNFASGDEDKKSEDNRTDETGDVIESNQGIPSVPGKPVITFY